MRADKRRDEPALIANSSSQQIQSEAPHGSGVDGACSLFSADAVPALEFGAGQR